MTTGSSIQFLHLVLEAFHWNIIERPVIEALKLANRAIVEDPMIREDRPFLAPRFNGVG